MHDKIRRYLTPGAMTILALFCVLGPVSHAEDAAPSDASAHVLQAEIALHRMDYLQAAREYRKAAELSESVDIARQATRIGSSFGFNTEAIKAAERWLELDNESDEALFHLARLQLRDGNLRAARRSYRTLIERGDGEPDQRLLSLISVFSEEDPEASYEVMSALAKPYRDSPDANYAVAVMALQAGEIDDAKKRALKTLELEPGEWLTTKAKLLYGRILLLSGDADGAIDYVARIIGDNPQPDPSARMELALIMMTAGRDDDALSQVNQVLLENSNQPDALRLMAIINFRLENLDAAYEDFQDLLASGQHTMDALYYLARIADYRDEPDRAIRLYSQVEQGAHAIPAQRRAAALIAFERDDADAAIKQLDQFARENPLSAIEMVQAKAQLLASVERYPEALDYYDRLIEYRPENEGVLLGRGELLLRMGRLDDAVSQYRAAAKRWPNSPTALNALGYTLADRTDRYREAEKLIRKALKYEPESPAIIDSLGWVLYKLGRHDEALVELTRAYERLDDPEVAAHIIEVLVALGRADEAIELLVAAESKDPESPLLKDVKARVLPELDD
ncbi:MAG: tetratricopeptide repeat protein [Woeseiaceae bacterium]|nr:tetratricopeptide repeat protein [Woeseiaceae bacterium]